MREDDELINVRVVGSKDHIVLATANGMAIRFASTDVRPTGRGAVGVKGISLRTGDYVVSSLSVDEDDKVTQLMAVSSLGYGKRTAVELYRLQSRGGIGLINFKVSPKTGTVVRTLAVNDNDSLLLLTSGNKIIRVGVDGVRSASRATIGVHLVKLDNDSTVIGVDTVSGDDRQETAE